VFVELDWRWQVHSHPPRFCVSCGGLLQGLRPCPALTALRLGSCWHRSHSRFGDLLTSDVLGTMQVQLLNSKAARPPQRAPQQPEALHQHQHQRAAADEADAKPRLRRRPAGPTGSAADISARRAAQFAAEVGTLQQMRAVTCQFWALPIQPDTRQHLSVLWSIAACMYSCSAHAMHDDNLHCVAVLS
jgi:hypothetical protein